MDKGPHEILSGTRKTAGGVSGKFRRSRFACSDPPPTFAPPYAEFRSFAAKDPKTVENDRECEGRLSLAREAALARARPCRTADTESDSLPLYSPFELYALK